MSVGKYQDNLNNPSDADLRISEIRYRRLFESARDGILILDAGSRKITDVNPFMIELLGYSREEFIGKELWEIGLLTDEEAGLATFRELQTTGYIRYDDLPLKTKDGARREVEFVSNVYKESDRLMIQCNIRDNTAHKLSKTGLSRNENVLSDAQRIAHLGSWDYDIQNKKILWSDEIYRIFGLAKGSLENTPDLIRSYIHPEDAPLVNSVMEAAYSHGISFEIENRILRPGGEERFVCSIGEVIADESGKPLRICGTLQDITERKRAEQEKARLLAQIEQHRQRLDNIITNIPGVVWETWNAPGSDTQHVNFINDYAEILLGYSPEEWIAKPDFWISVVHPDDRQQAVQTAAENFRKRQNYRQEYRWVAKDGRTVWVEANVVITKDADNQPTGLRGINLDITERKRMEQERAELAAELNIERERLQNIFDYSPAFIFTLRGPQLVFEMANPAYYQIVGERDLIGMPVLDAFPEIAEQGIFKMLSRVYTTGEPVSGNELPIELKSFEKTQQRREQHFVNFVVIPLRASDGSISGIVSYGIDVTEQVLARNAIEESKERYRFLFNNNPLPMWVFDVETLDFLSVNDAAIEHYGFSLKEFLSMTLKDIRSPEDVPALLESTKKEFTGRDKAGIFRHRKKDGSIIYVEIISSKLSFDGKNAELVLANDVTERRNAEEALRQAENNYRHLVESSPGIVYLNEPRPPYKNIYVSPNVKSIGYSQAEWQSTPDMWEKLIYREDQARVLREFRFAAGQGLETNLEYRVITRDGRINWWHDKGRFVLDAAGNRIGWQGIIVDITATKELEEQLRQSQKLESVGRLAGGIAHDFNNMLTAINGYSELTLRRLSETDPLRRNIEEIKKAGLRSADLTHQLLAFSRQQVLQSMVIELNQIIADTTNMLERLIGEDIELTTILNTKVGRVKVDPGQFSQIILNLAVNARDAMPDGGKLTVETANVFLDLNYTRQHVGFLPGAYVMLAVSDTGIGMSEEIKRHIFEPFFTTKEVGRGTGLGLATVYGIVKQSGGNIEVYSEEKVGTTFKIYLPRVAEKVNKEKSGDIPIETAVGSETILLVEDEELVRNLSREMLQSCGYKVIEARNGVEAIAICESGDCKFDLLMTDVVMPQMGGRELAEKLKEKLPELLILFTSGYTADAVVRHGVIEINSNFIQKPYTFDALAQKVRELLDAKMLKDSKDTA